MRTINWTGNDNQPDSILGAYRLAVLDAARQKDKASLRLQPQHNRQLLMPELPELEVIRDVLNRRILGQTILTAEAIPPGGPIVVRDLTGEGSAQALAGACFQSIARRGKFLALTRSHAPTRPPAGLLEATEKVRAEMTHSGLPAACALSRRNFSYSSSARLI